MTTRRRDANPTYPIRRNPRLTGYDYAMPGMYFVTICTSGKECFFGQIADDQVVLNDYGRLVEEEWSKIGCVWDRIKLDVFIVMPNHIHGIMEIEERQTVGANRRVPDTLVGAAVSPPAAGAPTGRASRPDAASALPRGSPLRGMRPGCIGAVVAQFKSRVTKRLAGRGLLEFRWQRNYYEHVVRSERELQVLREYVVFNAAKWATDSENPALAPPGRASRPVAAATTPPGSPLREWIW